MAFNRVRDACELGLTQFSLYGFSTENWGRASAEVSGLMDIFSTLFDRGIQALEPLGIRLKVVGARVAYRTTCLTRSIAPRPQQPTTTA